MMKTKNVGLCAILLVVCFSASSQSAVAQKKAAATPGKQLTQLMITYIKEMIAITGTIKTVADVEKAEPRIAAASEKTATAINKLVDSFDTVTAQDFRDLRAAMGDAKYEEWMVKAQTATEKLRVKNAEAADALDELSDQYSTDIMEGMNRLMDKMQGAMEEVREEEADEVETTE